MTSIFFGNDPPSPEYNDCDYFTLCIAFGYPVENSITRIDMTNRVRCADVPAVINHVAQIIHLQEASSLLIDSRICVGRFATNWL
jgi:hypothetical protein